VRGFPALRVLSVGPTSSGRWYPFVRHTRRGVLERTLHHPIADCPKGRALYPRPSVSPASEPVIRFRHHHPPHRIGPRYVLGHVWTVRITSWPAGHSGCTKSRIPGRTRPFAAPSEFLLHRGHQHLTHICAAYRSNAFQMGSNVRCSGAE